MKKFKVIAVVGCSHNPFKAAGQVPQYMQEHGYRIIPINPGVDEILGEKTYKSLFDLPEELKKKIAIVNIFRPSETVGPIVEQAIQLKKKYDRPEVIWMQSGIENEDAAKKARAAEITVIMDSCIMAEHLRIPGNS